MITSRRRLNDSSSGKWKAIRHLLGIVPEKTCESESDATSVMVCQVGKFAVTTVRGSTLVFVCGDSLSSVYPAMLTLKCMSGE